jgi:small ligand-binding sensory domain FIST
MIRAGVGFSTANNPRIAAAEATATALAQAGITSATGALCFATPGYGAAYQMIVRAVASEANTRDVVGCSSVGVIAGETEIESGNALAVLVFGGEDINATRFFVPTLRGRAAGVAADVATAVRPKLGKSNLLILLADTYNFEAEATLNAIAKELPGVAIAGGGASEDGSVGETFVFCGDTVSSNAVSGMLLSGDFDLTLANSIACGLIGSAHRVTAARENIVIELDGRPAYEVFAEAAGPLSADRRRALAYVFVAVPVYENAKTIERGKFVVRNIIGASEEHGVIAVGFQPKIGDTFGFVLRDAERSRQDLKATLDELSVSLDNKTPPAFGLYFDCVSRGAGLYNIPGHDSAYIRRALGPVPIAGFFTGFEIGNLADHTALLQYSGVLALISERKRRSG